MPLVLLGTPIGNLGDLSPRATEVLRSADLIACEDTRRTGRLLELTGIGRRPMLVLNEHTEASEIPGLLRRLDAGALVAVVSDAGMPGVSDPGQRLVAAAVAAGHEVRVVPGPSAAIAALVASGLPTARFAFEGFLPRKGAERAERLAELAAERRTTVIYESPHRLARTLADLEQACGVDRRVAVARELTKLHEEVWRGPLGDAARWAQSTPARGEVAIVLAGAEPAPGPRAEDVDRALQAKLAAGRSVRDAATEVAASLGLSKRAVYERALQGRRRRT